MKGVRASRHVHVEDGLAHDLAREVLDHVRHVVLRVDGVHFHRGGRRHRPLEYENRREAVYGSHEQSRGRERGGGAATGLVVLLGLALVVVGAGGGGSHGCCRVQLVLPLFVLCIVLWGCALLWARGNVR